MKRVSISKNSKLHPQSKEAELNSEPILTHMEEPIVIEKKQSKLETHWFCVLAIICLCIQQETPTHPFAMTVIYVFKAQTPCHVHTITTVSSLWN